MLPALHRGHASGLIQAHARNCLVRDACASVPHARSRKLEQHRCTTSSAPTTGRSEDISATHSAQKPLSYNASPLQPSIHTSAPLCEAQTGGSDTDFTAQLKGGLVAVLAFASIMMGAILPQRAHAAQPRAEATSQLQSTPATPSNPTRIELLNYRLLQAFTLPGYGKIMAILAIGAPFVLLGGFAYRQVTGDDWILAMTKSYYVLNKVPSEVSKESRRGASVVLNCIHLASIGTFAVVVGVFTSEIAAGVKAMRQGNFPLPESNHTVILGWSDRQSIIMLREMIESQRSQETTLRSPIVILSDLAKKPEIDEQLLNEFGPDIFNQVIMTRQGNPARPQDLARVAAGRAGTIIWMLAEEHHGPQHAHPDVALSATLTCLHAMRTPESLPQRLVVCEEGGGSRASVVRTPAGQVAAARLHSCNTTITRLTDVSEMGIMAQVALQPQLSSVFEDLCQSHLGQVRFYTMSCPELHGKSFKQARKAFPTATLVGLVDSATGASYLTPPDSRIIGSQDQLVLLASCKSKLTCMPWKANLQASIEAAQEAHTSSSQGQSISASKAENSRTHKAPQQQQQQQQQHHVHSPKNVFVLGHGPMKRIAASLQEFCGPGSRVTLLLPEDASFNRQAHALQSQFHNKKRDGVHFKVARGNLCSNLFLRRMGVAQADAVLLGEPSPAIGVRPVDADAQVAASILQLQSLMETEAALSSSSSSEQHHGGGSRHGTGHKRLPLSVVSCVSNANMKSVLQRLVTTTPSSKIGTEPRSLLLNLIMAEELLGGMLTQVASDPMLGGVFEELLNDNAGAEVYIRNPREYGVSPELNYQWEEVQDDVRSLDAVAVGYRSNSGTVHLGKESREAFKLQEGERLVVLSYN